MVLESLRILWPTLPAELRNSIYTYASAASQNPAKTNSLPLAIKTYDSSHTRLVICPVHYGNLGLLALEKYGFLEAAEYHDWLLKKGVEIRVAVEFRGHVNTFIQQHWDTKVSASFRKLVRKDAWIAKAARWDVRIIWNPKTDSMQRAKPGTAGKIVNGMVSTLLSFQDAQTREDKSDVAVRLCVPTHIASLEIRTGLDLGFAQVLVGNGAKHELRELVLEQPKVRDIVKTRQVSRLKTLPKSCSELDMLLISGKTVEWGGTCQGRVVARTEPGRAHDDEAQSLHDL